jgi:uncharacterized protein
MTMRLAALLCLTLACGSSQSGTDPVKRVNQPTDVKVEPFAQKKQEEPHYQAIILGTKPNGDSTVIPLTGHDSSARVDALWVRMGGGGLDTTGGFSEVTLSTAPQTDGRVRVGMYEQFAGGMGPQWRAAVWISSFISSGMLGKDLTDFKFTAENTGYIDGASAGALMTAGFLATFTGASIDAKATMTGIVNPDGTVGPVGGIPHKFAAALAAGKKRLGYPVGQQFDFDFNERTAVDIVDLVTKGGGEAVEISDINQAYTFLTGKTLPQPIPVDVGDMALEPAVEARMTEKYKSWREMLTTEWAALTTLRDQGKLPAALRDLATRAESEATAAEAALTEGLVPLAYQRIVRATVLAVTANATYQVLEQVRAGNLAAARDKLFEIQAAAGGTEIALRKVAEIEPGTISEYLMMLSSFQRAVQGWGFQVFAAEQIPTANRALDRLEHVPRERLPIDVALHDETVRDLIPTVLAIARSLAASREAMEALEIEKVDSLAYSCIVPNLRRMATSYSSAASANLAYYESLFVKDTAAKFSVPDERAKMILMQQQPDYLTAFMAFQLHRMPAGLPAQLRTDWGEDSRPWNLATLAGAIQSYYKTSLLISKEYSLRVAVNPFTGEPTAVAHQKAFTNMMQAAERKAREHARTAKVATGSIPVAARIHYQNARVLRDSASLADRIRALEYYWASSVYSQAATMLARN